MAENPVTQEEREEEEKKSSGNTGLPFGLCKKYGIALPDNATPRMAWEALKNKKGITPNDAYRELKKEENEKLRDKVRQYSDTPNEDMEKSGLSESLRKDAREKMLQDDRVIYSKRWTRERMADNLNAGTREMQDVTVSLFNADSFGYNANERNTAYYRGYNKVCIRESNDGGAENNSVYEKGQVFYHETWHGIDANYGEKNSKLSVSYKSSTGMTLYETLIDETRNIQWEKAKDQIKQDTNSYYKQQGIDREKIFRDYEQARQKGENIYNSIKQTNGYNDAVIARYEYFSSEEYKRIYKEFQKVSQVPSSVQRKWGDLSDVYDGYTTGNSSLTGMGHGKTYWRKEKEKRATEAFAEIASSKATNAESYKVLKTYCPKTVAVFEEIFTKLEKGEIKSNGRPRYQL